MSELCEMPRHAMHATPRHVVLIVATNCGSKAVINGQRELITLLELIGNSGVDTIFHSYLSTIDKFADLFPVISV